MDEVYAYIMTFDTGFAPCIYDGKLDIACCKTNLRYKVAKNLQNNVENIWVIGVIGKVMAKRHKIENSFLYRPIYVAKFTKSSFVTTKDYFSEDGLRTDQKFGYLYKNDTWYIRKGNPHGEKKCNKNLVKIDFKSSNNCIKNDIFYRYREGSPLKENYVLITDDFLYYGKDYYQLELPDSLMKQIKEKLERAPRSLAKIQTSNNELEKIINSTKRTKSLSEEAYIDDFFVKNEKRCKSCN